jgi:hypothetical protein
MDMLFMVRKSFDFEGRLLVRDGTLEFFFDFVGLVEATVLLSTNNLSYVPAS